MIDQQSEMEMMVFIIFISRVFRLCLYIKFNFKLSWTDAVQFR